MWANPFGVSKSVAVVFPVSFELGITVEGVPSTIGLAGGVSIANQAAYSSLLLRASDTTAAFCAEVENFDLHKLVTAAICGGEVATGATSCLGTVGDVLTSVSLESGVFKFNSGAEVKATRGSGPCATIEGQSVFMELQQLSLFQSINMTEMCLAVSTDAVSIGQGSGTSSVAAVVRMDPVTLGPLTLSQSDVASCQAVSLPASSPCQMPNSTAAGPLFALYAAPSPAQKFSMTFDGAFKLLSQEVHGCIEVDDKHFKAQVNMTLSDSTNPIKFSAVLAAAFASTPPSFDFHVAANLESEEGVINAITSTVTSLLDQFTAAIHDTADTAKAGLQSAYNALDSAQGGLQRAQQAINNDFAALLASVHDTQSWAESVKRNCKHHDHRCGFWHPVECMEAAGCWIEYGVAKTALWTARQAIQAAEDLADAGLQAAEAALSVAQGVITAAQAAVDVAVSAVDALNDLVSMALKTLGTLVDITSVGFDAWLATGSAAADFHAAGHVLGQEFDIGFSAALDMASITSVVTGIMKGVLKSIFASKGLPAPDNSQQARGATVNSTADAGGFFLPSLSTPITRSTTNTQRVSVPPFTTVPGAIDQLCLAVQDVLANMTHSAVTVDFTGLPWSCTLNGNDTDACLTAVMELCFLPGHAAMLRRRRLYLHQFLTEANVRDLHRDRMGSAMKRCKSKACNDIVLRVAAATQRVTLVGSNSGGVGLLPNLNLSASNGIVYSIDLSDNQFESPRQPVVCKVKRNNSGAEDCCRQVENVALYATNLSYLDVSGNARLASDVPNECLGDYLGGADTLRVVAYLGNDALVPDIPAACMNHSSPIIKTKGLGVQLSRARTAVEWQPWEDLCAACPAGLGPVNCTSHVCVNQTLLDSLRSNLTAELQHELNASGLSNVTVAAEDLDLLALDDFGGQVLITYRLRPNPNIQLSQAQHFAAYAGALANITGAAVSCPVGLVGPQCAFTCFTGWQRADVVPPDTLNERNVTLQRLPKCIDPAVTATCPNATLVAGLQAIVDACPTNTSATPSTACVNALQAVPPLMGLSSDCKILATNASLPACVRAHASQYAAAFCPSATEARDTMVAPGQVDPRSEHSHEKPDAKLNLGTIPPLHHIPDVPEALRDADSFLSDLVRHDHLPLAAAQAATKMMSFAMEVQAGDEGLIGRELLSLVRLLQDLVPLHLGHVAADVLLRFVNHHGTDATVVH